MTLSTASQIVCNGLAEHPFADVRVDLARSAAVGVAEELLCDALVHAAASVVPYAYLMDAPVLDARVLGNAPPDAACCAG